MAKRTKLPAPEQAETEVEVKGDADKRFAYILQVSFWEPRGGPVRVFARSKEHAAELMPKMIPGAKDLAIHDIALESDLIKEDIVNESDDPTQPPTSVAMH